MFKYISLQEQILKERQKNMMIEAQAQKNTADIDYIAMMTDVDLDMEEAEEESEDDA